MKATTILARRSELEIAVESYKLVSDILDRDLSEYIIKGCDEAPEDYTARINNGVLTDAYQRTVVYLQGLLVKQEPYIDSDNPFWSSFTENCDGKQTHLKVFTGNVFEQAINEGMCGVYIDYLNTVNEDGEVPSLSRADNIMPNLFIVPQYDILGYRFSETGVCTYLRYKYTEVSTEGETDTEDTHSVYVMEVYSDKFNKYQIVKDKPVLVEQGIHTLGLVPIVFVKLGEPIYDDGSPACYPALMGMAELVKAHYISTIDQRQLMRFVRQPPYIGKYLTDDTSKKITFGPATLINCNNDQASLESVGVDSASVIQGRQEIIDIESAMGQYGINITSGDSGNITATHKVLEAAQSISQLEAWASSLHDAMEEILLIVSIWMNIEPVSLVMATEFKPLNESSPELILQMVDKGIISREEARAELQSKGYLNSELDNNAPDMI